MAFDGIAEHAVAKSNADPAARFGADHVARTGTAVWLMDMIAPFGGADEAMKELREKIFPGQKIKTLQPAPSGDGMAVVEW